QGGGEEWLERLEGVGGGRGRSSLLNGRDDGNHVALADLMNAPPGQRLSYLPTKQSGGFGSRAVLGQMLRNECLQQILDPVCHDATLGLAFLGGGIATFQLRGEHLLRGHARLMEGDSSVWTDGVFSQLRAGTAGAVENDEHFATFGRDLDAEPRAPRIPVDDICRMSWQRVD